MSEEMKMDAQQFTYWLQGFSELNDGPPTEAQWQSIRDHLAIVFTKVTPPMVVQAEPFDLGRVRVGTPLRSECATVGDPLAGRAISTC